MINTELKYAAVLIIFLIYLKPMLKSYNNIAKIFFFGFLLIIIAALSFVLC